MKEKFELESSNSEAREAINLVNEAADFELLAQLAYDNKLVGGKFNPLRYEYLKNLESFKGVKFESLYPEYDTETGLLTDNEGNEVHVTQVYDEATDESFFSEAKPTIIDFLSLSEEDFEQAK